MPLVAARDYRASWEIPYDFHPRIRAYPGTKSVVRAYMDAPLLTASAAEKTTTAPTPQRGRRALRHNRFGSRIPGAAPVVAASGLGEGAVQPAATTSAVHSSPSSAQVAQPLPQYSSPPQQLAERPSSSPPEQGSHVYHEVPTLPLNNTSARVRVEERSVGGQCNAVQQTRSHVVPLSTGCRVPQRPVCATVGVARRVPSKYPTEHPRQSSGPPPPPSSLSATASAPPATATTAPSFHTGYHQRTKERYSLPPSYGTHCAQWRRHPVPIIRVADRYDSPPRMREYRLNARQVRHASRANFVNALRGCISRGVQEVIPQRVTDALMDTRDAHCFDPSTHNYNVMVTNAFHDSVEERAARLQTTENRMWERMIVNVAPLEIAHQQVVEAGGTSVLDNGHVTSPIYISAAPGATGASAANADGSFADGDDTMAVVVRPFPDELLGDSKALRLAEAQRRWPKGREWDRQVAIQRAVGATAQEAIIDLGIDPRYRHPGDRPGRPH
ncbi:hypothetical protein JKF63_07286 [Porcisia hertigi]|uniref:Uncharacterized protein n=1 Tax=Porcisia hertigi TaxID=2761500 RepID=A0A836LLA5_9TRYP|nr:hypothetical protein JKF63_07286 [Porcisia hertigi]